MKTKRKIGRSYHKDVTGTPISALGDPTRISGSRRQSRQAPVRQGVVVKGLDGAVVTDDGRDVLISVKRVEGKSTTIVCPAALVPSLVSLLAQSLATAQRRQDPSAGRQLMVASGFQIQPVGSDGRLMAIVRISGGAELSFLLPATVRRELAAAFGHAVQREVVTGPGTR